MHIWSSGTRCSDGSREERVVASHEETSSRADRAPSGCRLPLACYVLLAARQPSVTELGAGPAATSPSYAEQIASVLAALGVTAGRLHARAK